MPTKLYAQEFVDKWRNVELKRRSASQEHSLDLGRLIGHAPQSSPTPPTRPRCQFSLGGQGWAWTVQGTAN